jgi:hypothetical protein
MFIRHGHFEKLFLNPILKVYIKKTYTHTTLHQAPIDLLGKVFNLIVVVFNSTSNN